MIISLLEVSNDGCWLDSIILIVPFCSIILTTMQFIFVVHFFFFSKHKGGLAGCVLADRLSADGKKVLVLEAGRPDFNYLFIRIPAGILRLFRSRYDWQYESSGEKACNGRNIFLQRGKVRIFKVLGGPFRTD